MGSGLELGTAMLASEYPGPTQSQRPNLSFRVHSPRWAVGGFQLHTQAPHISSLIAPCTILIPKWVSQVANSEGK